MKDDPTISRIREARHQISKQCGHDPKVLVEYYIRLQEQHRGRLVPAEKLEIKEKTA